MSASEWLRSGDHFFRRDSIDEIRGARDGSRLYLRDGQEVVVGGAPGEVFASLFPNTSAESLNVDAPTAPAEPKRLSLDDALERHKQEQAAAANKDEFVRKVTRYWGGDPAASGTDRTPTVEPEPVLKALLTDFMARLPDSHKSSVLLVTDWDGTGVFERSQPLSDEAVDEFPQAKMWTSKAVSFFDSALVDVGYVKVFYDFTILEQGTLYSGEIAGYDTVARLCAEQLAAAQQR